MATNIATVEVRLVTSAQKLKQGMDQATRSVERSSKRMTTAQKKVGKASSTVQDRFRRASHSIAAIQGPLGPVAGRITSLGTIIGNVGLKTALFTVGIAALVFAMKKMVTTIAGAEQQFLRLEGILKATGSAAGLSLAEIEDLSREIGIATLASTQKVRDAAGILLTFKSVQGETFKEALRLTQDLAELGLGDVKQGAIQLGKALEEPIVGLGALRRVGVSFTEDQKELIKVLDMTGRKAEAQKIILEALDKQVGGAGVKAAQGLRGAIDSLVEGFTIWVEESIYGRKMVDALTTSINWLAEAFGNADKEIGRIKTAERAGEIIEENLEKIKELESKIDEWAVFGENDHLYDKINAYMEQNKQLRALQIELQKWDRIKKNQLDKKKKEEEATKRVTIAEKEANVGIAAQVRNQERLRENMFKTNKEQLLLNEQRKLEDKLRGKLGTHAEAEKEIIRLVKLHTDALKIQVEETERLTKIQDKVTEFVGIATRGFDNLSNSIAEAMVTGQKEGLKFKNILQSLAIDLTKTILNMIIFNKLKEGAEIIGGKIGDIIAGPSQIPPNPNVPDHIKNASGGSVTGSTPRLVGERGPELFVPNQAGRIIPSSLTPGAMGSRGGVVVNQNLNFALGVTNTVRAEIVSMMPQIQNQTLSAVAEARMRGGKFAKAFS